MLKKNRSNSFISVFSYNGIVFCSKILASFVVSKASAIYLGPSGYAIVGNFKNVLQGVLGVTASGFESGIIKYIAESKGDKKQLKLVVTSAVVLSLILSCIVGLFFILFSKYLSSFILKDVSLSYVFVYLAFLLPLMSLSFLVVYMVNGLQKFRLYTWLITISNVLNALLTFVLIYYYSLEGALLASLLVPSLSLLSTLLFRDIRNIFEGVIFSFKSVSKTFLKSISTYIIMASYSAVLLSLSYLFIRNTIILNMNEDMAGFWEAMNKISSFYMLFFSSLFTLYLLPKLVVNKTLSGYFNVMKSYFKYLVPFIIVLFFGLYLFRGLVIKVFLTEAFKSIEQYFYLQLLGDFIKIIAFSFAYQFHAKKMVKFYFITDAILYISFYLFSLYFIKAFNIEGVFYAYITSAVLYLFVVTILVYFKNSNYLKEHV